MLHLSTGFLTVTVAVDEIFCYTIMIVVHLITGELHFRVPLVITAASQVWTEEKRSCFVFSCVTAVAVNQERSEDTSGLISE